MSEPLIIDYYTDILCVWAWIAQRRIDEMASQWGRAIDLRHHSVDVFGDTATKMASSWHSRGGVEGFAVHVREAAADHETAPTHPDLWTQVRPATSANAHLLLKATERANSTETMVRLALALREAFFVDARNIGELEVCLAVADELELDRAALSRELASGAAMAALLTDYRLAEKQGIKGSPSWVMNDGRQILYGNVGYRILNANIEELLRHPEQEASWC